MRILLFLFSLGLCSVLTGQSLIVEPYLQNASSNSIFVLWETDSGEQSLVEWGDNENLGNSTNGISYTSVGTARIHEVHLTGLKRLTQYYYRVRTDSVTSQVYKFKTPPFSSDGQTVTMVAMSDMQKDNSQPRKFENIVNQGVLKILSDSLTGEISENLNLVLIPGDLVVNGNNISQWRDDFFGQGKNLFSEVPLYPVLGNHENNSDLYFKYFKLPENGSPAYLEHWYYKDLSNIRIIGLNSNGPYTNQEQLDWLSQLLEMTCMADSIDFVFAQLHHPYKSELWTPGESDFTGDVIKLLEEFTTECNKPSVHFFGHTHGYSRGQSRDHKHLWINVASAGGAIDNWGEFPNFDYEEFTVSQDEYGFVQIEASNDNDPRLTIKRISRGDQDVVFDNIVRDSITLRRIPNIISKPIGIFPSNETLAPECVTLEASDFESSQSLHGQSHWQVVSADNDFTNPEFESWKNFENWYYEINTQANDDLSDEFIQGLSANTEYKWRVRYRDREFNWSEWSEPAYFSTSHSIDRPNLIANPGAEEGLTHWQIAEGVVEALPKDTCNGIAPYKGDLYFIVGGLCDHSDVARLIQEIDVSSYQDSIDQGSYPVTYGAYLSNYGGLDLPEMKIIFHDSNENILDESPVLSTLNSNWTLVENQILIPAGTRQITVELKGTRNGGTDNDSYFDDIFLKPGHEIIDCSNTTGITDIHPPLVSSKIVPNPSEGRFELILPFEFAKNMHVYMMNINGNKASFLYEPDGKSIHVDSSLLVSGQYYIWITDSGRIRLNEKVIITK